MPVVDGRRVAVAGIGVTGRSAALALTGAGARVVAVDDRDDESAQAVAAQLREAGVEVRLGERDAPVDAELVVTSPGWRPDHPLLTAAAAGGATVVGEPELAWRLAHEPGRAAPAPWLAVTGTNGKTTTVGLLAGILGAAGLRTDAVGNVGRSVIAAVLAEPAYDVLAVELSSFQLHYSEQLTPQVGAFLNLGEDHLDWHQTMAAYAAAKVLVWRGGGLGAYNVDDELVSTLAERHLRDPRGFSLAGVPEQGMGVRDGAVVDATRGPGEGVLQVEELGLVGPHNLANGLAAALVCRLATLPGHPDGVPLTALRAGLLAARPGAHRGTVVAQADGVRWVDDSKATNPAAASTSLAAYPSVVWVAGGLLKGADVGPLVSEHRERLRAAVLIGTDASVLAEAFARHAPDVPVVTLGTGETDVMHAAAREAHRLAEPGDTVLLAPAAASWDQFRDYAERGDRFAAAAQAIAGGAS